MAILIEPYLALSIISSVNGANIMENIYTDMAVTPPAAARPVA